MVCDMTDENRRHEPAIDARPPRLGRRTSRVLHVPRLRRRDAKLRHCERREPPGQSPGARVLPVRPMWQPPARAIRAAVPLPRRGHKGRVALLCPPQGWHRRDDPARRGRLAADARRPYVPGCRLRLRLRCRLRGSALRARCIRDRPRPLEEARRHMMLASQQLLLSHGCDQVSVVPPVALPDPDPSTTRSWTRLRRLRLFGATGRSSGSNPNSAATGRIRK